MRLRLSGDSTILPALRSCLANRLSQMPDVKVATSPTAGARFIVDLVATKDAGEGVSASLVVAQTFPMEEFRSCISRITADIGEKVLSKEYTERDG